MLGTLDTPFGRDKVARYGDGWLPLTFNIADVRKRMRACNRDPDRLEVSLFFLADVLQTKEVVHKARDSGASRCIFRLPVKPDAEVLRALDYSARFI
ncbi:MAG: hypothetical protein FJ194_17615 [Gammaproteobacteria bacterium]|nr:hypothetical protein [Gammaproteobacteria bacterium]